jgi:hypothetical protein
VFLNAPICVYGTGPTRSSSDESCPL